MASEQQGLPLDLIGEPHDCCECASWHSDRGDIFFAPGGTCYDPEIGPMPRPARRGGCREHFKPLHGEESQ